MGLTLYLLLFWTLFTVAVVVGATRYRSAEGPAFKTAWLRAFIWTYLFALFAFPLFLYLGLFHHAGSGEEERSVGRGYIRGSLLGLGAIFVTSVLLFLAALLFVEHQTRLERAASELEARKHEATMQEVEAGHQRYLAEQHAKRQAEEAERNRLAAEAERERALAQVERQRQDQAERARYESERLKELARQEALNAERQKQYEAAQREAEEARAADESARAARRLETQRRDKEVQSNAALERMKSANAALRLAEERLSEAEKAASNAQTAARVATNQAETARKRYDQAREAFNAATRTGNDDEARAQIDALAAASGEASTRASTAENKVQATMNALDGARNEAERAKAETERCKANLAKFGIAYAETKPIAPPPEARTVEKGWPIYVLKDGKRIEAKRVMQIDDNYAIQQPDGKLVTIPKRDVASIEE